MHGTQFLIYLLTIIDRQPSKHRVWVKIKNKKQEKKFKMISKHQMQNFRSRLLD